MLELNNEIRRLEMRCEQLIIHLQPSDRTAADAGVRRADLYAMLKKLEWLKRKRAKLECALGLSQAA